MSIAKKELSDVRLKSMAKKPDPKRAIVWDALVPGFGARPTKHGGTVSFVIHKRIAGSPHVSTRSIGLYPIMTLEVAREEAKKALLVVKAKKDPTVERRSRETAEAQARKEAELEAVRRKAGTLLHVFEARRLPDPKDPTKTIDASYVGTKLAKDRRGKEAGRLIRRHLLERLVEADNPERGTWGGEPVDSPGLQKACTRILHEIKNRGHKPMAQHVKAHLKVFDNWILEQEDLRETSFMAGVRVDLGKQKPRTRFLKQHELWAFIHAADEAKTGGRWGATFADPFALCFLLMLATGAREMECGAAEWTEFSLEQRLWFIPAWRVQSETGTKNNKPHLIPLNDLAMRVLMTMKKRAAMKWRGKLRQMGPDSRRYVFGSALRGWDRAKKRLHRYMKAKLDAIGLPFEHFIPHDIRRTVATHLKNLGVRDPVISRILNHTSQVEEGAAAVTFIHYVQIDDPQIEQMVRENAEALHKWSDFLERIANATPEIKAPTMFGRDPMTVWRHERVRLIWSDYYADHGPIDRPTQEEIAARSEEERAAVYERVMDARQQRQEAHEALTHAERAELDEKLAIRRSRRRQPAITNPKLTPTKIFVDEPSERPWEREGVSRATWYRKQGAGGITGRRQPAEANAARSRAMTHLDPETEARLVKRLKEGGTHRALAKEFGVNRGIINRTAKKHNVIAHNQPIPFKPVTKPPAEPDTPVPPAE